MNYRGITTIDELIKTAVGVTPEMEKHFESRTNKHIKLVQKYCKRIHDYAPERFEGIVELGRDHDQSKFEEPERTPYVRLTWKHKFDNYESYKKPGMIEDDDEINDATLNHIKHNMHHPEYWTDKKENLLNEDNRDEPPEKIIDATKMPDLHIATMVADWCAMSEELKNNTPQEWADKNVNKRWKFTDKQKNLIYELIDAIWNLNL